HGLRGRAHGPGDRSGYARRHRRRADPRGDRPLAGVEGDRMSVRVAVKATELQRAAAEAASAVQPSTRELLRELAIQTVRGARQRANGPAQGQVRARRGKLAGAGNYPIPVRTGTFGRGFG